MTNTNVTVAHVVVAGIKRTQCVKGHTVLKGLTDITFFQMHMYII